MSLDDIIEHINLGKYRKALLLLEQIEDHQDYWVGFWKWAILMYTGSYDGSSEIANKYLEQAEKEGMKSWQIIFYAADSYCFSQSGKLSRAKSLAQKALTMLENLDNFNGILGLHVKSQPHAAMGLVLMQEGDYEGAKYHFQKIPLEELDWPGHYTWKSMALGRLGIIHSNLGDFEEAEYCLNKRLKLATSLGNKHHITRANQQLAELFLLKGEKQNALLHLNKLRELMDIEENTRISGLILFKTILLQINLDKINQAKHTIDLLRQVKIAEQSAINNYRFKLAKALILQESSRISDKTKSQEILIELTSDSDFVDISLYFISLSSLAGLYIWEYSTTKDAEILDDIDIIMQKLDYLVRNQSSVVLYFELQLIKIKLYLLKGKSKDAELKIKDALNELKETNFRDLTSKFSSLQQSMNYRNSEKGRVKDLLIDFENLVDLIAYKDIFHPVKLAILQHLYKKYTVIVSELRKSLDVSWGVLSSHLRSLEEGGYLITDKTFIEDSFTRVVVLTQEGENEYLKFHNILTGSDR